MTTVITEVLTGQAAATPDELRALATRCEMVPAKGLAWLEAADLNARICAALLPGWDYVAETPAVPEERAPDGPRGRKGKVIKPGRAAQPAHIKRTTRTSYPKGSPSYSHESAPAPKVISDIAQAWGLLHGRLLLALYDARDGFASARVAHAGQPAIYAEGCAVTAILSLCAAILRCEASVREAARRE
jgi:hypothetical protein